MCIACVISDEKDASWISYKTFYKGPVIEYKWGGERRVQNCAAEVKSLTIHANCIIFRRYKDNQHWSEMHRRGAIRRLAVQCKQQCSCYTSLLWEIFYLCQWPALVLLLAIAPTVFLIIPNCRISLRTTVTWFITNRNAYPKHHAQNVLPACHGIHFCYMQCIYGFYLHLARRLPW